MKRFLHLSCILCGAAFGLGVFAMANHTFRPGELWLDEAGQPINAHGGGFLYEGGKWYWFGELRTAGGNRGVSCYSSRNLYDWKNEGVVLRLSEDPGSPIARGSIIERPKVIHNRRTGKYVMWFHNELRGQGYSTALAGTAVSDRPTGPYRFLQSSRPDGEMSRDMTLFVDDDEEAYLFTASEDNLTMHVHRLSSDYTTTSGQWSRIFEGRSMEAPAVFKYRGEYYFVGSDCTGWDPNPQRSAVSESIWGPWRELGNPAQGQEADTTYGSQTAYVVPVEGKAGAFIWVGDRWHPDNLADSRYVLLPVQFTSDRFVIPWIDGWDLTYFDHVH
jgi:hypothetical protein